MVEVAAVVEPVIAADVLVAKLVSPEYTAVIELPVVEVSVTVRAAVPVVVESALLPSFVVPL
jgi:hypothetical protein